MLPPGVKITTEVLLRGAIIFALIDLFFVPMLVRWIKPARFRELKWPLVIASAVYWTCLWAWVLDWGWDPVYRYIFPDFMRPWLAPLEGLIEAFIALALWWAAFHFPKNAVLGYFLLGGLWGAITHFFAVQWGIVDKPPSLQGASPVAVIVIAVFEFIFYWCIVLCLAVTLSEVWQLSNKLFRKGALAPN